MIGIGVMNGVRPLRLTALISVVVLAGCSPASEPQLAQDTGQEIAAPAAPVAATDAPQVMTVHGPVTGGVEDGVQVFKGIPYGADTSTSRFQAPQPPQPWSQPRSAAAFGDSCPQLPYPPGTAGGLFESWFQEVGMSEDCLRLNVWTPGAEAAPARPVMVWLHGGGFTRGSGSSRAYDGVRLANRGDVVVVSVNHRLNIFGFTNLTGHGEQFADSANAGMLDLVLALQWVRDNIAGFGGDPDQITIFGESGGGMKVTTLMAMPSARGLFHRAIVQSGPWLQHRDPQRAAVAADQLLAQLAVSDAQQLLDRPVADIQQAAEAVVAAGQPAGWTGPMVDDRHLMRAAFTPDAPAQSKDIPMLIGVTRTETSLFIGASNPETFDATWETLPAMVQQALPQVDAERVIDTYRRLNPGYNPADVLFSATTDAGFFRNSVIQADRKAMQGGANTYFYVFNWDTPVQGGKWRSPHALEIGMVFDNVAYSASMSGTGESAQAMADIMAETWIAFARSGDPNNAGLPDWPAYNAGTRPMMLLDLNPRVVDDYHGVERQLFEGP